jgi:hypothetical protein
MKSVLGIAYSYTNWRNGMKILLVIYIKQTIKINKHRKNSIVFRARWMFAELYTREKRARMIVSVGSVTLKLLELSDLANRKSVSNCRRWLYRFLGRNHLSIRNVTKQTTLTNDEGLRRLNNFYGSVEEVFFRALISFL